MGFKFTETCDKCGAEAITQSPQEVLMGIPHKLTRPIEDASGGIIGYLCSKCREQYEKEKWTAGREFDAKFFGKEPEQKPEPDTNTLLKMAYDRLLADCEACDHSRAGNCGDGHCRGCICFEILGPLQLYCNTHAAACSTGVGPHCKDCEIEAACAAQTRGMIK